MRSAVEACGLGRWRMIGLCGCASTAIGSHVLTDPYLSDGYWWRHEWWATDLRRAVAGGSFLGPAIEAVFRHLDGPEDCSECFERWMDEASGGREVDDFPERLSEEHVIRIMALEDAVLVRHALDQWLVALDARRARRIQEEMARGRAWAEGQLTEHLVAEVSRVEVPRDPAERPSARMRARSQRRG